MDENERIAAMHGKPAAELTPPDIRNVATLSLILGVALAAMQVYFLLKTGSFIGKLNVAWPGLTLYGACGMILASWMQADGRRTTAVQWTCAGIGVITGLAMNWVLTGALFGSVSLPRSSGLRLFDLLLVASVSRRASQQRACDRDRGR